MFPRKYRLPLDKKQSFEKTLSTPCFLFKTSRNSIGQNRFGVVISNASVKKSTRRHLWKRRFANAVRLWPNLERDFLVIVSPRIENMTMADLKVELENVLKSLNYTGGEKYSNTKSGSAGH